MLANRLSQDSHVSVLVIDKGRVDDNWMSRVPLLSMNLISGRGPGVMDRRSEPIATRANYQLQLVTADAIGGTSRINGTLFTRGVPAGYNDWAESHGLDDWTWEKVEPYFKSLETAVSFPDDPSRGYNGQLLPSYLSTLLLLLPFQFCA